MAYKDKHDPRLKESRKRWYRKNKARQLKRQAERKKETYQFIQSLKEMPCKDCGVQYPPHVMDFDHLPEFEKSYILNDMRGHSKEAILAEVEKCEVVCSNCHRERTFQRSRSG